MNCQTVTVDVACNGTIQVEYNVTIEVECNDVTSERICQSVVRPVLTGQTGTVRLYNCVVCCTLRPPMGVSMFIYCCSGFGYASVF